MPSLNIQEDPDIVEKLRRLLAVNPVQQQQEQAPQVTRAVQVDRQAADLESQVPTPQPKGFKEHLVNGIGAAMGTFSNPNYMQDKAVMERQRQQDLLGRVQGLRQESAGLQKAGADQRQQSYENELSNKQFESNDAVNKARVVDLMRPPQQGSPPAPRNPGTRDVKRDGRVFRQYFDQADPSKVTYEVDTGPVPAESTGSQARPGSIQPLVNAQGVVTSGWDTETGRVVPINTDGADGARKSPVPSGTMDKERDLENSYNKINELGNLFKEDFVGPVAGRYYDVKSKLPLTSLPEGYTDFKASQADLKNHVIKLITGAQMGEQEADRILKQVPTENDKPEMWLSKYKLTQKNTSDLREMIKNQTGGTTGSLTERIRVRNKATGATGTISAGAFNPEKYERLP